jgi:hypothetical protein
VDRENSRDFARAHTWPPLLCGVSDNIEFLIGTPGGAAIAGAVGDFVVAQYLLFNTQLAARRSIGS